MKATCTVELESIVQVPARVAGVITTLGPDPRARTDAAYQGKKVDFRTPVEEGTLLAQIDDRPFKARVGLERANCKVAEADLAVANRRAEAAALDLKRYQELLKQKATTEAEPGRLEAVYEQSRAAVKQAEAGLDQSRIALQQAELDLSYTSIRSPMKGTIIIDPPAPGRRVGVVPDESLFLIADLSRLQVRAEVNEADIARVHEKQSVRFTTDDDPEKSSPATSNKSGSTRHSLKRLSPTRSSFRRTTRPRANSCPI